MWIVKVKYKDKVYEYPSTEYNFDVTGRNNIRWNAENKERLRHLYTDLCMSREEIAEIFGFSISNVKSLLNRFQIKRNNERRGRTCKRQLDSRS